MSVEKQTGDSPTSTIAQKIEQEKHSMEESSCKEEETAEITSHTSGGLDGVSESEMSVETEKVTNEARTWFAALSNEERAVALGFIDGPFLATLSDCSPWSAKGPQEANAPVGGLDWRHKVNLKEVEQKYALFEKEMMKSDAQNKSAMNEVEVKDEADAKEQGRDEKRSDEDGEERRLESDALRIRSESESQRGNVAVESEGATKTSTNESAVSPIFDHMCAVFPSAFRFVSGNSVDGHIPYVTVKPSYLDASSEELLLVLDASARSLFGTPFLCSEFSQSGASTFWLDRLSLGTSAVTKEATEVSLFALLLSRLESAVWEAFSQQKRPSQVVTATAVEIKPTNDGQPHRRQKKDVASAHETKARSEGKRRSRTFVGGSVSTALMHDLISHARTVDGLTLSMDTDTLKGFMSPFIEACFGADSPAARSDNLESLFVTPLSWLLHTRRKCRKLDFGRLDGALNSALRRVREHELSETKKAETRPEAVSKDAPKQGDIIENEVAKNKEENPRPMPAKKKKKKRNKRRRKGSSGASKAHAAKGAASEVSKPKVDDRIDNQGSLQAKSEKTKVKEEKPVARSEIISPPSQYTEATDVIEEVSVKSESSVQQEQAPSSTDTAVANRELTVSRVAGALVVATPVSKGEKTKPTAAEKEKVNVEQQHDPKDDHLWETVEVRRMNRKKSSERSSQSGSRGAGHSTPSQSGTSAGESRNAGGKKSKSSRSSGSRRKPSASKKMVRDIISSILDTVEEQVRKKKQVAPPRPAINPWKSGPPAGKPDPPRKETSQQLQQQNPKGKKGATLRDVVLGKHTATPKKQPAPAYQENSVLASPPKDKRAVASGDEKPRFAVLGKKDQESPKNISPSKMVSADQNTAPTYQETVSAVSNQSNAAIDQRRFPASSEGQSSKSDTSSGVSDEAPQNRGRNVASPGSKEASPVPPLPTLLNAENAQSTTSSVASSLEVPHTSHRHLSHSAIDVKDVGYHLLDVCDRLSREMSLFMNKRAQALNTRRRERGALLAALQDCVSAIWPGRCHVESYGSCAAQLDLPSSDLDVVVVGLDRNSDSTKSAKTAGESSGSEGKSKSQSRHEKASEDSKQMPSMGPYGPMPMRPNSERIMRLAAELERQPWAVQINAIPTASVPVVKILADPSRLLGSSGGEWMTQQQHFAAQAAAAAQSLTPGATEDGSVDAGHPASRQQMYQPWRGADVMNGLLSLDITFEGPEHGGIGSTEFSVHAVNEACQETGLSPDATPFVQVLMVLKELLAQRKLNEPYSGGLSSYALLLLVVALLRERAVIREEIERVEKQRQAVAAGDTSAAFCGSPRQAAPMSMSKKSPTEGGEQSEVPQQRDAGMQPEKKDQEKPAVDIEPQVPAINKSSSWASVAMKKKPPGDKASKPAKKTATGDTSKESASMSQQQSKAPEVKKPSFADLVAKSAAPAERGKAEVRQKRATVKPDKTEEAKAGSEVKAALSEKRPSVSSDFSQSRRAQSGSQVSSTHPMDPSSMSLDSSVVMPSFFQQGYNDVIEVLCSGETTAGKLLMHFLLYYGQHFDAQTAAIDISGKHERDFTGQAPPYSYLSPFIQRKAPGSIDPVTGMLTVDPIIIYDPLEGAENNNVARRCFAWNSIRWIFAQSYSTLSSAAERSATPPTTPGGKPPSVGTVAEGRETDASTDSMDLMDPSSSLLRCLLSF